MKKILFILMLLFTTTLFYSQTYYTDYTSRMIKVDSCWTDWTDWEQCFTEVTINDSTISIYDVQEYTILEIVGIEEDDYSQTIKYKVVYNKDKVIFIRFRKQIGGIKQLYLDYENVIYVYNLNY